MKYLFIQLLALLLSVRSFSWWLGGISQSGVNVSWKGQQDEDFLL
jgi:hypothetical protein